MTNQSIKKGACIIKHNFILTYSNFNDHQRNFKNVKYKYRFLSPGNNLKQPYKKSKGKTRRRRRKERQGHAPSTGHCVTFSIVNHKRLLSVVLTMAFFQRTLFVLFRATETEKNPCLLNYFCLFVILSFKSFHLFSVN